MKRAFMAPPDDQRCTQDITLRSDGSGARCMRRKVLGDFCRQHAELAVRRFCEYCGGNDEAPPDHCTDCERPSRATGSAA